MKGHLLHEERPWPRFKNEKRRTEKMRRASKKRLLDDLVLRNMRMVRLEDMYCRIPECACRRFVDTEVAHVEHRGAGGNPDASRSDPSKMVLVCRPRHKGSKISIDAGTLRPVPLTADGTRGALLWQIDRRALTMSMAQLGAGEPEWVDFAREAWPHIVQWVDDAIVAKLREIH